MASNAIKAYSAAAGLASFLQTLFVAPSRSIASIIPGCAIEERHLDRLTITQHPVEIGAAVSDHAYKLPSEVTLRWMWSDSGQGDGYVKIIFQQLLALQNNRTIFDLYTGKKSYQNMILTSLMVTTDKDNELALNCIAVCQQVIIVSTQAATVPATSLANPQQTGSVTSTGAQTLKTTSSNNSPSVLVTIFGH